MATTKTKQKQLATKKTSVRKVAKKSAKRVGREFFVSVYAYKGKLIFAPSSTKRTRDFVPTEYTDKRSNLGCVVVDSKKHLRISNEALKLLRKIKRNHDDSGDVDWWMCDDGTAAFSWFGAIFRVMDPTTAEASRDFAVRKNQCTVIPNILPEEIQKGLKNPPKPFMWKEPFAIGHQHGPE